MPCQPHNATQRLTSREKAAGKWAERTVAVVRWRCAEGPRNDRSEVGLLYGRGRPPSREGHSMSGGRRAPVVADIPSHVTIDQGLLGTLFSGATTASPFVELARVETSGENHPNHRPNLRDPGWVCICNTDVAEVAACELAGLATGPRQAPWRRATALTSGSELGRKPTHPPFTSRKLRRLAPLVRDRPRI